MTPMSVLQAILYVISELLLLPVMVCLVLVFAYTLYAVGGFLAEWTARRRSRFQLDPFLERFLPWAESHAREGAACCAPTFPTDGAMPRPLERFLSAVSGRVAREGCEPDVEIALCLRAEEARVGREVDRLRMVVRIGPSLGLLGTLIPMGTALAALAGGNLEGMANNLIIAFTTTVVGLAAGTVAYVIASAKARWAAEDLDRLAYVAERLSKALSREAVEGRP